MILFANISSIYEAEIIIINISIKNSHIAAFIAVIAFSVYFFTLLPGMGYTGDTAKLQYSAKVLGVTHTPGYPAYSLLSHLFYLIPAGSPAFRINLMSAFFASIAIVFLYFIILMITGHRFIAFASGLLFAFSQTFWSQSIVAEVYTLNAVFMTAVILCLLIWEGKKETKYLLLACFIYSLSLGHHPTMILIAPAVIYFIIRTDRTIFKDPVNIALCAGFLVLAAIQYSYVFMRSARPSIYVESEILSFKSFIWWITGAQFKGSMFTAGFFSLFTERIPFYLYHLKEQFLLPGMVAGLAGLCLMIRDRLKYAVFLIIMLAGNLIFTLNYAISDIHAFFIPTYIIFVILIAFSLETIRKKISKIVNVNKAVIKYVSVSLLAVFLVLVLVVNLRVVNQRKNTHLDEFAGFILENIKDNSIILTPDYKWWQACLYKLIGEEVRKGDEIKVCNNWLPSMILASYPSIIRDNSINNNEADRFKSRFNERKRSAKSPVIHSYDLPKGRNLYIFGRNREFMKKYSHKLRKAVSISRNGFSEELYELLPAGKKTYGERPVSRKQKDRERAVLLEKAIRRFNRKRLLKIDFLPETRGFLDRGWSESELLGDVLSYCWADSPESTISIPLKEPADYTLEFMVLPFVDENSSGQQVEIYINGRKLSGRTLVNEWKKYTEEVPAGFWNEGWNRIKFRYNDVAGSGPGPDDEKPGGLTVAFSYIKLTRSDPKLTGDN